MILRAFLLITFVLVSFPGMTAFANPPAASASSQQSSDDDHWLIAPYLFAPSVDGSANVEGISAEFDYPAEELASGLNAGGMGYLQWTRSNHFLYIEGLGFRYKDRVSAFQDKLLNAEIALAEFGYGYNFCVPNRGVNGQCRFVISPYAGIRHSRMDISIVLDEGGIEGILLSLSGLPGVYQAEERWIDPAAGAIIRYDLTPNWSLYTKLDAAGFSVGYNDYWNAMTVLHWKVSDHWSIAGGYRLANFDAQPGGGNKLSLELRGDGPMAGVVYRL